MIKKKPLSWNIRKGYYNKLKFKTMARKNKKNGRKRQKGKAIILNIAKNEYEKFLSDKVFCRDLILERL